MTQKEPIGFSWRRRSYVRLRPSVDGGSWPLKASLGCDGMAMRFGMQEA